MEIVVLTFATADSMYRFSYLRGHEYGQLEGIVGAHGGQKFTVHVELVRDLVGKDDAPQLPVLHNWIAMDNTIQIDQITDVSHREFFVRADTISIPEMPV